MNRSYLCLHLIRALFTSPTFWTSYMGTLFLGETPVSPGNMIWRRHSNSNQYRCLSHSSTADLEGNINLLISHVPSGTCTRSLSLRSLLGICSPHVMTGLFSCLCHLLPLLSLPWTPMPLLCHSTILSFYPISGSISCHYASSIQSGDINNLLSLPLDLDFSNTKQILN